MKTRFIFVRDVTIDAQLGTEIEITIQNISKKDVLLPFVADPADIEPRSRDYQFDELRLWIAATPSGGKTPTAIAGQSLYARHHQDYVRLAPGQWISVRLKTWALQQDDELLRSIRANGEVETVLVANLQLEVVHYKSMKADGSDAKEDHDCSAKHMWVDVGTQNGIFFRSTGSRAARKESH